MRTSCVQHPAAEPLIIIRQWQVEACGGNHCAAGLLSFFEYWHNIKQEQSAKARQANDVAEKHGDQRSQDESVVQWHNSRELESGLLGLFGKMKIAEAIELLKGKGFIRVFRNPNPRYKFDATKHFVFESDRVNEWLANREYRFPKNGQSVAQKGATGDQNGATVGQKEAFSGTEVTSETTSLEQESAPAAAGDATSGQRDCAGKPVEASGTKSATETLFEPEKPGTGPKRAKPSRPVMTPEAREQARRRQEFIDGWWQAYRQRTGMPYHPANRDADIASANRITSNGRSVSELLDLARFAWEEGNVDQWTWNQAQTVAGFAARIAAIQAAYVQKRGRKLSPEEKAANIAAGDEYKNNLDW